MKLRWILFAWPGLTQIAARAEVSGLLLAVLFSFALNFLLVATFVWEELLSPRLWAFCWLSVAAFWLVCVATNVRREWYFRALLSSDNPRDLFSAANKEYLRRRFSQSRDFLQQLLELDPRDAEARLLLISIGMREGRIEECDRLLRQVQRLRSAAPWAAEIRQQWVRLRQLRRQENTLDHPVPS